MPHFWVHLTAQAEVATSAYVEAETADEAGAKAVNNFRHYTWHATGYPSRSDIDTPCVDEEIPEITD